LPRKEIIVAKSKEVKTGSNLAESSREGYGSRSAVLPMMMISDGTIAAPTSRWTLESTSLG
jgi:hypothetical protein